MCKIHDYFRLNTATLFCLLILCPFVSLAYAGTLVSGHVYDLKGNPLPQAMVSLTTGKQHHGADVISVFTDTQGHFSFPQPIGEMKDKVSPVSVRILDYEQLRVSTSGHSDENGEQSLELTVIMRRTSNYADVAPASAWLANLDAAKKEQLIKSCVGCHQVPAPEVRAYAKQIANVADADQATVRKESWRAIIKYMNFISAEEFGRGMNAAPPEADRVYGVGNGDEIVSILSNYFTDTMEVLDHYEYGAPLAVSTDTVIREYVIPRPNAVREALMAGIPPKLWVADVSSNRVFAINVESGEREIHEVPTRMIMGPHSMHRGQDGSLWITPFFPTVLTHLDPDKGIWQKWELKTKQGELVGIHDLSFGYKHELLTDKKGRIWFSDIANNAVGYLDPENGDIEIYRVPEIPGRPGKKAELYGLVMTSDRKYIWYSQLGIGSFGSFNVETLQFDQSVQLPSINAGPRRLTISDEDIMYVPLWGAGQLLEYDTRVGRQIGLYDLPDRASAPYAATWDPKRRVVWIPVSNNDVIYRFDPKTKTFGVIPLPRAGTFLRMIDVDPKTGVLITSYANIVENSHGPRMALIIDPGDKVYQAGAELISELTSPEKD